MNLPPQPVAVIGAPLDLGQDRRGVDMGPSAIRYAGLERRIEALGRECADWGNVPTPVAEAEAEGDEELRFLEQIKATCAEVAALVRRAGEEGYLPLVLGGDHSVALGTLAGLRRTGPAACSGSTRTVTSTRRRRASPGTSTGWCSRPRSASAATRSSTMPGRCPRSTPARVALVGVRSLDDAERAVLRDLGAAVYTMSDLDRLGVEHAMREALAHVEGPGFVHVSLDMDVVDPSDAPGVGTPVRGGLTYREAHLAMELVAESGLAGSVEVVEVNPILDRENETARLAVELVASALGARIL